MKGTGKQTEDGKGAVEAYARVVLHSSVDLTCTT